MNVITRGMRNAFRNATRTLSIIIIVGLSLGLSLVMLIAHQAVQDKVTTTLSSIGNTISIRPAGVQDGSTANNVLTTSQMDKVSKLAHITHLTETLSGPLFSSGASQKTNKTSLQSAVTITTSTRPWTPPIQLLGTTDPTQSPGDTGTTIMITSGKAIDGGKDTNNALVSTSLANKNHLTVGSTFTAYDQTLSVAGIFDSDTQAGNNTVTVSLPTYQRLAHESGDISRATATVDSLANLSSATTAIQHVLGSSADVTSEITQANNALQPLDSVKNISLYSLVGAVIAGAIIILLTMIMIVRERKREIGAFKAIGFSNLRIMVQFMSEALTFTVLGAVIGVAVGIVGADPVTNTLVNNSTASNNTPLQSGAAHVSTLSSTITNIHAQIGWSVILYGLGAAILIALTGSALASFFISKVMPAEVLRSE
jgi:putative ABC transport system permease protein